MAQNVRPTLERVVDHLLPVEPNEIEAAFDGIWRDASSGALDASSVRLRVSNVLVWGIEHEAAERFEHLMETLAQQHPCRGILAALASNATKVESVISAHCWRTASGGKHICSEEIFLRSAPSLQSELSSAVFALLVPELPVHLWLVGDPDPLRRLPEEMREAADCLYVDSGSGSVVAHALTAIQSASSDDSVRIVDLTWQRGEPWRELIAQHFDGRAAVLVDKISAIEVAGGAGSISSAAFLITGWLASRLDLTVAAVEATNTRVVATFYDGSRPVVVHVAAATDGEELADVTLHAADATLSVSLHAKSEHLHVRSDWVEEPVHRTVATEPVDDAAVLTSATQQHLDPDIYDGALRLAIALTD